MKILFFLSVILMSWQFCLAQKPAYFLYNTKGKKVSYKKMLKKLTPTDVILFGEMHNNPISHWLFFELSKNLAAQKPIQIGMEMLERHQEEILQSYLEDNITETEFLTKEGFWSNFGTDYFPVIKWAKGNSIPVNATNITRKYANLVYKKGFKALDSLAIEEKKTIAPLPIPFDSKLSQYQKMLTLMDGHGGINLVKAQAIKDATMAHFILDNKKENYLFLHLNGAYHSDFYEGIFWYLKQYQKEVQIKTITSVEQKEITKLDKEHFNKADYIICVPETMTKTY